MKTILSSKRHHYLAKFSIFLITVALVVGMVGCGGGSGPDPYADYIKIYSWIDLDSIRNNLVDKYVLMNDLDSTTAGYEELASTTADGGKGWEPIGTVDNQFTGTFDGQGYEIRNLFINRPDESGVGLFGVVGEGGAIENVGVVNADVTGRDFVGGLVGGTAGTVDNCYSTGNVTANTGNYNIYAGGLVGGNAGTVDNCYSTGNVTGGFVGGLVGGNAGTVSNSYFTGSVTGRSVGNSIFGGLVGTNGGFVSNSYYNYDEILFNGQNRITIGALFAEDFEQWLANDKFLDVNERLAQEDGYYVINNVSDFKELLAFGQDSSLKFRLQNDLDLANEANFYVPYLAGEFHGNGHRISNLNLNFFHPFPSAVGLFGHLASGGKVSELAVDNVNITGGWAMVGGLVGRNDGTVSNSYATGNVTGNHQVGGLVGGNHQWGTVSNSYATGNVTGDNWGYGGLVGLNLEGTVSNSYATGNVTGGDLVGGLVGDNRGGTVGNSFWDIETSGQATSDGGTGKTTAEMRDIDTFSGATWDIIAVAPGSTNSTYTWNIVDDETYPFLSWQSVS